MGGNGIADCSLTMDRGATMQRDQNPFVDKISTFEFVGILNFEHDIPTTERSS